MLDVLDVLVPGALTRLDLAAGPASVSQRLLARRPDALDVDPVLQEVGRQALGDAGGRLRWITDGAANQDRAGGVPLSVRRGLNGHVS